MKDGKTFLMAPADYVALFEKDKDSKENQTKESVAKETTEPKDSAPKEPKPNKDSAPKEPKPHKDPKPHKEHNEGKGSKVCKESNMTGGSSMFGKASTPEAEDGIGKRQSSKLKRSGSKDSKKVKRSIPPFADKDHPQKKSLERIRSGSHGRIGHGHGHKSADKKSSSKKSVHSHKGSKGKDAAGASPVSGHAGGNNSHHGCTTKEIPVMSIGTMTVINYAPNEPPKSNIGAVAKGNEASQVGPSNEKDNSKAV